jgi:RND family efflux transporter MFP subunit
MSQLILLVLTFLVVACAERSEPAALDQSVRPARIFVVQDAASILEYQFVGRVAAARTVDMTFEVSGPLRQLPVLEGQTLAEGDLVAALDTKDFELAVREAQVQLQLARQDLERKQRVLAQRGIARSVVDDAKSNYELQQVRLQKAQESLTDARLYAPFEAYVARRYVDNFVTVQAGQKIVRLNDPNRLLVTANVPEYLFATATNDQVVEMYAEFDFAPQQRFALTVYETSGEADELAQTYEVSLQMAQPEQWNILPGMTATVTVRLRDSSENAGDKIIPTSALVSDAQGAFFVWIFDSATGQVSKRYVEVAAPQQAGVPVLSGLQGGDMVVATGASQLLEGMIVRSLGEPSSRL